MLRHLQCIAAFLLACASLPALADIQTWAFKYEPFRYTVYIGDDDFEGIGYSLEGRFSAEDRDLDGVLELAELTSFVLQGDQPLMGCPIGSFHACGVDAFSLTQAGDLHFSAWSWWQESYTTVEQSITTGVRATYNVDGGAFIHQTLYWIPETRLTLTRIAPVPEPSSWLMMAAGLGLLGVRAARRRKP